VEGVTKRCRLSWLTNSALVYEPKCWGKGESCGISANEYSCTQETKNFADLTSYLPYGWVAESRGLGRKSRGLVGK
jgi:hypothetical protein